MVSYAYPNPADRLLFKASGSPDRNAPVRFYSDKELTNLLTIQLDDDGVPGESTTEVTSDARGLLPERFWVDGYTEIYASANNGPAFRILPDFSVLLDTLKGAEPINLSLRGVSHTNTAASNTALIQAAVVEAEASGRSLVFPWVPDGSWIDINERIIVATGGISLVGQGEATRIRQTVFPRPVFEILSDDVIVDGFRFDGGTWNATGFATLFRGGETLQGWSCGVWMGGHRNVVRNVRATNFISAVRTSNFDVPSDQDVAAKDGCSVENITHSDVAFGLLVRGVKNFTFRNIKGSYKLMPGSGLPPHLLYFTGSGTTEAPIYSENVTGSDCTSDNGQYSFAYQLKYVKGGAFGNLVARNSAGLLHVMNSQDLFFNNMVSTGDIATDVNGGSIDIEDVNERIIMSNITIAMANNGKPVRIGSSVVDSVLKDSLFISNHSAAGTAGNEYDIDIRGTRNVVDNCTVKAIGATVWAVGIGIWAGTDNRIIKPKASGHRSGAVVRQLSVNGQILDYNLADITLGANPIRKVDLGATGAIGFPRTPASAGLGSDLLIAYDRADHASGTAFTGVVAGDTVAVLNSTTSGHAWTKQRGDWYATGNQRIVNATLTNAIFTIDAGQNNIDLSAGIRYVNREALAARVVAHNTYISFRLNHFTNMAELYKTEAGVGTLLASGAFVPTIGRRYRHQIKLYGSLIECFIDGVRLFTHTLSAGDTTTFGTSTVHGLLGNGQVTAFFDNVEWRMMT